MSQLSGFWLAYYQIIILLGWVGALIFPIVYAMTMRFWESEIGMHFFSYGVVVWLNLTPAMVFVLFGDFPGRGIMSFAIFHLTVIVIWWRAIIFLRIYRQTHQEGDNLTPSSTEKE